MPDKAQQIAGNGATKGSKQQAPKIPRNPKEAEHKAPGAPDNGPAKDKTSSDAVKANTECRQEFRNQISVDTSKQQNGNKYFGGSAPVNQTFEGQVAYDQSDQQNGNVYDFRATK